MPGNTISTACGQRCAEELGYRTLAAELSGQGKDQANEVGWPLPDRRGHHQGDTPTPQEETFDRARPATWILKINSAPVQRDWARQVASDTAGQDLIAGRLAISTCAAVLDAARRAGDQALEHEAIERLTAAALASGHARLLVRATRERHLSGIE